MIIGLISDIHSNLEALEATYKEFVNANCDKVYCLGDVVGYGADPAKCIDFIRENKIMTVRGNHDHYVGLSLEEIAELEINDQAKEVIFWTRKQLNQSEIDWLNKLEYSFKIEENGKELLLFHSSLFFRDGVEWPYIIDTKIALSHFDLCQKKEKYGFFGHTHIPLLFSYEKQKEIKLELLKSINFSNYNNDFNFLIGVGSVGQPRDGNSKASSVIFNTETEELTHLRVKYDIKTTQAKILAAGLPKKLAKRLKQGN